MAGKKKDAGGRKVIKYVAAVALIAAASGFCAWFFNPKTIVKRDFNHCVKAFEEMDLEGTLEYVSDAYGDNAGNNKETLREILPLVFNHFKGITVNVSKLEIELPDDDERARLTMEGSIFFKRKDDTLTRIKGDGEITIWMTRESDHWKLVSVKGIRVNARDVTELLF